MVLLDICELLRGGIPNQLGRARLQQDDQAVQSARRASTLASDTGESGKQRSVTCTWLVRYELTCMHGAYREVVMSAAEAVQTQTQTHTPTPTPTQTDRHTLGRGRGGSTGQEQEQEQEQEQSAQSGAVHGLR